METEPLEAAPANRRTLTKVATFLNKVAGTWASWKAAKARRTPNCPRILDQSCGHGVPDIDKFFAANEVLYRGFRKTRRRERAQRVREVFITDGRTVTNC